MQGVFIKQGGQETSTNYIAAKIAYDNKIEEFISSQKGGSCDLQQVANTGLNKTNYDIPHLLNSPEVLPSPSDKAQFLINTFLRILILVKNIINHLNLLKASGPNCILVVVLKNCEPQLSYILDDLFNMCMLEFVFPDSWNVSSEVPVLKIYHEKLPTYLSSLCGQ